MQVPSGENETDITESVCPRKGSPTGSPVPASHNRIVVSEELVTMRVPSGENEADLTELVCLLSILSNAHQCQQLDSIISRLY